MDAEEDRWGVGFRQKELTEGIIGCFFRVHRELGHGFLESVYEQALLIELRHVLFSQSLYLAADLRGKRN